MDKLHKLEEDQEKNPKDQPLTSPGDHIAEDTANQLEIKALLFEQLEQVIDPELGIDVVNLGLIYDCSLNNQGHAHVLMTLTTMGCPLVDILAYDIEAALLALEAVTSVEVEITFDPPWSVDKMSRYAKIALGINM